MAIGAPSRRELHRDCNVRSSACGQKPFRTGPSWRRPSVRCKASSRSGAADGDRGDGGRSTHEAPSPRRRGRPCKNLAPWTVEAAYATAAGNGTSPSLHTSLPTAIPLPAYQPDFDAAQASDSNPSLRAQPVGRQQASVVEPEPELEPQRLPQQGHPVASDAQQSSLGPGSAKRRRGRPHGKLNSLPRKARPSTEPADNGGSDDNTLRNQIFALRALAVGSGAASSGQTDSRQRDRGLDREGGGDVAELSDDDNDDNAMAAAASASPDADDLSYSSSYDDDEDNDDDDDYYYGDRDRYYDDDNDEYVYADGRRRPGRPRSEGPPPGRQPARDLELRTVLMRVLGLRAEQLRPRRASWRRLMSCMTAGALRARVRQMVAVLGPEAVRAIACRCPASLLMTPDHVMGKLDDINRRLMLPRQTLLAVVATHPTLLGYTPEAVGARVALLVQELGRSEDFVLAMVACQPVLLGMAPATLRHRADRLHEAASLLPTKWGAELDAMSPTMLGRLLRCSDSVLARLLYTYLRTATNGRKWERVRAMATICCRPRAAWHREQPLFQEWLLAGEADRQDGLIQPWPGWADQPPRPGSPPAEGQYDWWRRGGLGLGLGGFGGHGYGGGRRDAGRY